LLKNPVKNGIVCCGTVAWFRPESSSFGLCGFGNVCNVCNAGKQLFLKIYGQKNKKNGSSYVSPLFSCQYFVFLSVHTGFQFIAVSVFFTLGGNGLVVCFCC
jgi:hypothetical protein